MAGLWLALWATLKTPSVNKAQSDEVICFVISVNFDRQSFADRFQGLHYLCDCSLLPGHFFLTLARVRVKSIRPV